MFLKLRTLSSVMRRHNDRGLDPLRRDRHGDLYCARSKISSVAAILKKPPLMRAPSTMAARAFANSRITAYHGPKRRGRLRRGGLS